MGVLHLCRAAVGPEAQWRRLLRALWWRPVTPAAQERTAVTEKERAEREQIWRKSVEQHVAATFETASAGRGEHFVEPYDARFLRTIRIAYADLDVKH